MLRCCFPKEEEEEEEELFVEATHLTIYRIIIPPLSIYDLFLKHRVFLSISLHVGEGSPPVLLFDIFIFFELMKRKKNFLPSDDDDIHTYRINPLLSFTSTHTSYHEKGIRFLEEVFSIFC